MQLPLWSFNWIGGGYNQVRAVSRADAFAEAVKLGTPSPQHPNHLTLVPDLHSMRQVHDEDAFWRNYPLMD